MKRFIAAYLVAALLLATVTFAVAEPRSIHEGILTGSLAPASRGTQVVVNPPPPPPPPTPVWTGNIPVYPGGRGCGPANANLIANAMWDVGANNAQVTQMLLIVSRESGCDSAAYNGNRKTGDDSWGFCQQNALAGWFKPGQTLAGFNRFNFASDPGLNARSCAAMYARCGFLPWRYGNYGCRRP